MSVLRLWHRIPGQSDATKIGFVSFTVAAGFYGLFQKKLLPEGISRFVSKVLFFPTLPFTYLARIGNLFTELDETLILGVSPLSVLGHPEELHKRGVRGVVNMCCEYSGPQSSYNTLGIKQLRLPTVDHFEPSVENLKAAVRFIDGYKKKGEKCYVHCKAGHGRAAAVALCWLMYQQPDREPKDLNETLCSKRKVRKRLWQQTNVKGFYDELDRGTLKLQ
jgi:atypical dual specificity phosphatase